MKFSYTWLRYLVDDLYEGANEVERRITLHTAECDGVEEVGELLRFASEATVISVDRITAPESDPFLGRVVASFGDQRRKVEVETVAFGKKTVVCGAPNCRVGMQTVYVPIGKKTILGVESDGMLASAGELGISGDNAGIVELNGPLPLDDPMEVFGPADVRPDHIIEVDNKSLTHRPDLWGHYGMAREVAAILGKKLLDPVKATIPEAPASIKVTIEDYALCPRYSALVFENVTVRPSPLWLQYRLEAIGLNPISNIVDVTNFVMAELAQPMHAFDADKLNGAHIIVRTARPGERIAALNGETYDVDPSTLLITDPHGPIAIAGIIGGADSAISDTTTRIVLESACFNASNIRKTSSRLKLRTDASMRFEKAQDPETTLRGLKRALELLEQVSPGIRLVGGAADAYRPSPAPQPIPLPLDWLTRKLGREVPPPEVKKILESLDFQVDDFRVEETAPQVFSVTPPTWRATKDITIKDDLVEEVGRMIGYGSITPIAPLTPARVPPPNPEREFHHRVRATAAAQGFTEVYNYSFLSEEQARTFDLETNVEIANPIAADQHLMRASLLPGILKNIHDNLRHFDAFRLFEIGREIHKDCEIPHLAAAIYAKDDGIAGLLELKRLAECLLPGIRVRPSAARPFEHPQRASEVYHGDTHLGRLFEFHPRLVEPGRAAVLDLDLSKVEKLEPPPAAYRPLRRYPTSAFDLSVIAPARTLIGDIEAQLTALAGESLVSIAFLRDFSLPGNSRSLSYRLTLGAADRTLSSEEVTATRTSIIDGMRQAGYDLKV